MDHDTTDSTPGAGKPSWRDRLGIPKENQGEAGASAAPVSPRAPSTPRPSTVTPRAAQGADVGAAAPRSSTYRPGPSPASEGLAERMRAQREAAERLAEQRLALARQRAASRVQETQAARAPAAPSRPASTATPQAAPAASPAAAAKFSFAETELKATPRPAATPAAPSAPRAPIAPLAPPAPRAAAPQPTSAPTLRAPILPPSRPSDEDREEANGTADLVFRAEPRAPLGAPTRAPLPLGRPAPSATLPATQRAGIDEDLDDLAGYPEPRLDMRPPAPKPPRPAPRPPIGAAPAARPRANMQDEDDRMFAEAAEEAQRSPGLLSRGPALLLGAMLIVVLLAVGGIFVWNMGDQAGTPSEGEVPVVNAPDGPAKQEADQAAQPETVSGQPAGKKQIYDRIMGEDAEGEPATLVPSEEEPVPQSAAPAEPAPDAQAPAMAAPPNSTDPQSLLPQPQAPDQSADPGAATDEPLPQPDEPDQSGAVDGENGETAADGGLPVPAEELIAATRTAPDTPAAPEAAPAPAQDAAPATAAGETASSGPISLAVIPKPKPAAKPAAKPQVAQAPATATPEPSASQTAALDPANTGQGYVVQLSSSPTEGEAKSEYSRIRASRSTIVGSLSPVFTKADLGTKGTVYRLSLGPLASKDAASKLCAQLIAAGEKDCVVRRQ